VFDECIEKFDFEEVTEESTIETTTIMLTTTTEEDSTVSEVFEESTT
jgi:hypothetical protein